MNVEAWYAVVDTMLEKLVNLGQGDVAEGVAAFQGLALDVLLHVHTAQVDFIAEWEHRFLNAGAQLGYETRWHQLLSGAHSVLLSIGLNDQDLLALIDGAREVKATHDALLLKNMSPESM